MAKLKKEDRRIEYLGISHCTCGAIVDYVSWKWFKGVPNKRHYSVICPNCRENPYMWRKTPESAIKAWNDYTVEKEK